MTKFANKPKGRPTKRKTLKTKYKIERKVKQHKKRVRKQARKLRGQGLKHKGIAHSDYLPNMFPFKQQILEEAKRAIPKEIQTQVTTLDNSSYGLTNIENKCAYLPKPKDNLIKKYVNNLETIFSNIQIVLELLEVRSPQLSIDSQFRSKCKQNKIPIVTVITKVDTLKGFDVSKVQPLVKFEDGKVVKFSYDNKLKAGYIEEIIAALKEMGSGNVLVAGKSLTGKHTLITHLAKHVGKYHQSPYEVNLVKITPSIHLIDSPLKLSDKTGYPLFTVPNPILQQQSLLAQEQSVIRKLFLGQDSLFKRNEVLQYFTIQDFSSVNDFLSKVGKAWKVFGKGGSIDINRVRGRILSDWFGGKLNFLLSD